MNTIEPYDIELANTNGIIMNSLKSKQLLVLLISLITVFSQSANSQTLKIATFNIQNFGKSKIAKTQIVDTLATIVRMFDVIAIQEISDITNQVPQAFLNTINQNNKYHYKFTCSTRTGNQPNDKSSQEQYAFYYNSNKVKLNKAILYDDSQFDYFQREPYIASFTVIANNYNFIICSIHTQPESAVDEIAALIHVAKWIPSQFPNTTNQIFCGDFNASCTYAKPSELSNLEIHKPPYFWIIPDNIKTNLSQKSDCTYDRFIVTTPIKTKINNWAVLQYFKSKTVSDHWPVYIELKNLY